jgi:RNA polymerase sigma-70 factor, ECF subfamily
MLGNFHLLRLIVQVLHPDQDEAAKILESTNMEIHLEHTKQFIRCIFISRRFRMTERELIRMCRKGKPEAQRMLYERYSPVLYGVVRRFIKSAEDAEDVFVNGMCKVLMKIDTYRDEGSFEGWMKRILTNEALMLLRKNKGLHMTREIGDLQIRDQSNIEEDIFADEILVLMDQLPVGYRTVFNMFVVEGYKHREIAELLGISINTSKSQLILAKKRMSELIKKNRAKAV